MDVVHEATLAMADDCRKYGTRNRLSEVLGRDFWFSISELSRATWSGAFYAVFALHCWQRLVKVIYFIFYCYQYGM